MKLLKDLLGLSKTEPRPAPDFPLSDPGPPCKNGEWCRCANLEIQRELWVEARDLAEADEVTDLAASVIADLDEMLEGHEPDNVPVGQMEGGPT